MTFVTGRCIVGGALACTTVAGCIAGSDDTTSRVAITRIVANQAVEMPLSADGETVVRDGTLVAGRRTRLSVDLERTDASDVQPLDLEVFVEAAGPSGEAVSGPHPVWLEAGEEVARFDVWVDGEAIVAEGTVAVRVRDLDGAAPLDGPRARWSAR
ncbi:MAG: hypothetical protein D6705_13760, partial [Deltaproteobacteria bacterium]